MLHGIYTGGKEEEAILHLTSEINVALQHVHGTQDTTPSQEVFLPLIPLVLDAGRQIIDALPFDDRVQSVRAAIGSPRVGDP